MKNYALLNENNIVINISIADEFWDSTGWVEYSEKKIAGIGYTYDLIRDVFIPPQPFNSWVLNEATCRWIPLIPYPENAEKYKYQWDEAITNWVAIDN